MKITHKGGDGLKGGDREISIVPIGASPVFRRSQIGSDFYVGDQIMTINLTNGDGNYTVTNSNIYSDGTSGNFTVGRYDVKMISYPYNSLIVDTIVDVK